MSPKSRGRPPGRGRRPTKGRRPTLRAGVPYPFASEPDLDPSIEDDCWFEEPAAGDRLSWAMPTAHGSYRGLDLELLDPNDEDQLMLLIHALHPEYAEALENGDEVVVNGEPVSPRLHLSTHQIVANRLRADDPPETWHTVQRLAGFGYDWHNIMHMIASIVAEDVHTTLTERRPVDAAEHARRLNDLPGDWPPPAPL